MQVEVRTKKFQFESIAAYTEEIQHGRLVLDWFDSIIKQSPCIKIDLITMFVDEDEKVYLVYMAIDLPKPNIRYLTRHLALVDRNLN